jgi:hypothetical protein
MPVHPEEAFGISAVNGQPSQVTRNPVTEDQMALTKALITSIKRIPFPGVNAPCEQLEFSYEEMEITIDYSSHDGKEG